MRDGMPIVPGTSNTTKLTIMRKIAVPASAGRSSGRMMRKNSWPAPAPETSALSSRLGSRLRATGARIRKAEGTSASPSTKTMPPSE
jgi:hypothetical protein